jgi:uncharacterized Fe-S cluster-containing radical SAM superfamily protein
MWCRNFSLRAFSDTRAEIISNRVKSLNFLVIFIAFLIDFGFSLKCNNATIGITNVLTKLLGEALEVTVKIFVRAFENANQEKVFQEISSYL